MPVPLVVSSSGSGGVWPESPGLQELLEKVVVLVQLARYDDALRGVVATIYTVVRAVGVSSSYSSHRAQQRTSRSFNRSASVWSRL